MAPGVRSRRLNGSSTGRKPLSRSRSGDGLWKGRRSSPNSSSSTTLSVAGVVVMMFLFMIILVAVGVATTVQISSTTLEDGSQGIQFQLRKRHPRNLESADQLYESHNSDERVPEEEEGDDQVVPVETEEEGGNKQQQQQQQQELGEEYDGGRYEEEEEQVEEEIDAARAELEAKEAEEREEARRQEEREEQIRREKDEQLAQLRAEKERLERQLREEEEQRQRAEEAAREAARLKEEEERRKEEELARMKKREEEKEAERLELLRKQEEMLREEEAHRRQQAEEARRQRQIEQEREIQKQREEERKLIKERSRLRREQQARQEAERNKPHPQKAMHLQTPKHKEFMKDARTKYPDMPNQATISFCDLMRTGRPGGSGGNSNDDKHSYVNPAVLILGMEDSSTDLMWHVISQILYPGRKTVRRTHELQTHATAVDYGMLDKMGEHHQKDFWNKVSEKSKGKWLVHVFCQQQQNDVAAGFPWLTTPDVITGNQKAHETLEIINTHLPKGSLKILRIKRNILDVIIRQAHHDASGGKAKLDYKKIFARIRQLQSEQDKVDQYLKDNNIPHLEVDFERLFPFDQWTDLVKNAQAFQTNTDHINVDWRQLSTPLENEWRDLLRYLKVFRPLSMFDILRDAMQTHEVNTFWIQKEAVDKFGYTSNALQGTHFFPLVRKPQTDTPLLRKAQKTNEFWGEGDEM